MNELVLFNSQSYNCLMTYEIHQSIPPTQKRVLPALSRKHSSTYKGMGISPDGSKMIFAHQSSISNSAKFWVSETQKPTTTQSLTYFDSTINSVAISNTHYAVAGMSPFLMLYEWSNHQITPLQTKGLGNVREICFNTDGTKLFVLHSTAPYLRVYDINDKSHKDVAINVTIGSNPNITYINHRLVFLGDHSTYYSYFKTFDDELNELFSYKDNNQWYKYFHSQWNTVITPLDEKNLLTVLRGNQGKTNINQINIENGEAKTLHSLTDYLHAFFAVADGGLLYISHNVFNGRFVSVYNLSDGSLNELVTNAFLNIQANIEFGIIKKDTGKITGQVRDVNNSPASRTIRAFDRKTGQIVAQTVSDTTGNYQLNLPTTDDVDVQFMAQDGENLPDLFYAKVTPELVP